MTAQPYRERPSALPGALLWCGSNPVDGMQTVLPDGCMDLIYANGKLIVAGPDTHAHRVPVRSGDRCLALRFAPGQAPGVLGARADELRDTGVDLGALWPDKAVRRARELVRLYGARGLETIARQRFSESDPFAGAVLELAVRGAPVARIAAETGYGPRQLNRRCAAVFGYGAKTLTRILRLRRGLTLAAEGAPLAEVAARSGYADQAHFSRDARALTGLPPSRLVH
ncbi:helix-turn-helix domain-containing protein [Sciscionella marina]|uniref:helix-turn-helix domain-containing protein n=1 Tax=Sciscionella marina TaxID=508770 RepID=UPI000368771B|nr:helix-turn-helix domain-containing protein [Sciscionella marina]